MAATGKTPILLYGSTTATNQPSAGNLTNSSDGCEIAINVADKNLFFKDSTNSVNTVPIRQSGASSDGWLSSTDWSTFNSKQPAGSYLTSVTVDAPLTGAGTSGSHLSIPAASGSTNGYLSSTDWTTFNNKSPAAGSSSITTVGTITSGVWNGTAIDVAHGGTGLTNLTSNRIPYGNGTSAFNSSAALIFDGTALGINVSNPSDYGRFAINGNLSIIAGARAYFWNPASDAYSRIYNNYASGNANLVFDVYGVEAMRIFPSAGISIGNTTDPGAGNLSVNGNLVIGTSGKGIDFSATAGTGTSELLADYEEGDWTPVDSSGAGLTLTVDSALYTKVGRQVFVQARITYPSTASGSTSLIGGLPYTSGASSRVGLSLGYNNLTADYVPFVSAGSALVEMYVTASGGSQTTNANLSSKTFAFSGSYTV